MKELRNVIEYLNARTEEYLKGKPTISDSDWDTVYLQLQEMEKETGIIYPDSPTQKVDCLTVNKLNKFTHVKPMLSLAKTKSEEEIENYFGNYPYVAMVKMDGLSLSLTYRNGELVSAATRGNGEIGEDITHNARIISNIPKRIKVDTELVVNGEIICPIDVFEENFSEDYKNPRNFAAGSIRLLASEECKMRQLKFVAWDCVSGTDFKFFEERLNFLKLIGFEVVPAIGKQISTKFILDWIKIKAQEYNYPIDGVVFRFNDLVYGDSLGSTAHHPNHSIAFKFIDESAESTLINIEYEPSRNGILTPIACFEPVELEGTSVSKCTLHNLSVMSELNGGKAFVGDTLTIIKSHQIIPRAISWQHTGTEEIPLPKVCPSCGKPVYIQKENETETLVCVNEKCPCRLVNQLDHFCSKSGLDIKGLSKATLEKLIDWGWVNTKSDIFELDKYRSEWIKKNGFGPASVDKVLNAIKTASSNTTLTKYLAAFGIPLIGVNVSKIIEKKEKIYERFRTDVMDNSFHFYDWEGFGTEMDSSLKTYNYDEMDSIREKYITFSTTEKVEDGNLFEGKTFAITGKLSIGRNRLTELIENSGGKVVSSVSKKTNTLIANQPENSAKYKNAVAYGVKIMTEDEVLSLIDF